MVEFPKTKFTCAHFTLMMVFSLAFLPNLNSLAAGTVNGIKENDKKWLCRFIWWIKMMIWMLDGFKFHISNLFIILLLGLWSYHHLMMAHYRFRIETTASHIMSARRFSLLIFSRVHKLKDILDEVDVLFFLGLFVCLLPFSFLSFSLKVKFLPLQIDRTQKRIRTEKGL